MKGLKKIPYGDLGRADFLAGQGTFKTYLSNGQGPNKSSSNKIVNKDKQEVAQAAKCENCLTKQQAGIRDFSTLKGP